MHLTLQFTQNQLLIYTSLEISFLKTNSLLVFYVMRLFLTLLFVFWNLLLSKLRTNFGDKLHELNCTTYTSVLKKIDLEIRLDSKCISTLRSRIFSYKGSFRFKLTSQRVEKCLRHFVCIETHVKTNDMKQPAAAVTAHTQRGRGHHPPHIHVAVTVPEGH